jgi:5-methylcytosine-specific restriction enzyme A
MLVHAGRCLLHQPRLRYANPAYAKVHKWYGLKRWARLRIRILQQQPFCRMCLEQRIRSLSQEIDHILPHRGNPELFWNECNLQGLCKRCHTAKTARGE